MFEGGYIKDGYLYVNKDYIDVLEDIKFYTIEDLVEYDLTLTQHAIKQLKS